MFTGIVTAVGTVKKATHSAKGMALDISAPYRGLTLGESIAVDGACLTVERKEKGWFRVRVIPTSIERTTFGDAQKGRRVNLERALEVGQRLGGHLVQGHVDAVGKVAGMTRNEEFWLLDIEVPESVTQVSIPLGSITVDGVSLTINGMGRPGIIQVSLIPFTLHHTTLADRKPGDRVHLEGDMIGKYIRSLLQQRG
jgi:riboflavin synthase